MLRTINNFARVVETICTHGNSVNESNPSVIGSIPIRGTFFSVYFLKGIPLYVVIDYSFLSYEIENLFSFYLSIITKFNFSCFILSLMKIQ
jgi:hypothetical protein